MKNTKKILLALCLLVLVGTAIYILQSSPFRTPFLTKEFSNPGMKWRPIPLWFWNNTTIEDSTLEEQLEKMIVADNYGGCAILPFGKHFSPSYLSDDYFRLYGRAVEKTKELGAKMSIYDEYGFPSGSMGAINGSGVTTFMNNHPEHTVKRLDKTEFTAVGGSAFSQKLTISGKVMSIVAWDTDTNMIVNLRDNLSATNELRWEVPNGNWKIMLFQCVTDGDPNVDYLSQEAVEHFVNDTHDAYYRLFGKDFGKTIISTFFDEPTMYRAQGRMWTGNFNEKFKEKHGFSPEELYPALWYDIGPNTAAARNLLFGMRSALYAEGFMGTINRWAEEHGILSTGHQDQEEIANPTSVSGDLMKVGQYMGMPGIDKIGGGRPTEDYYKVVSSSANNWDKTYVMSETYGAMGNIPEESLYQIAIEQYTKGVNHLIPHAVWYNDQDITFLPELSWRNPLYNKGLARFNRFLSRLNYMLARPGRHVADVAVLYPIQTQYAGHYLDGEKGFYQGGVEVPNTDYLAVSRILTDELGTDFTYLHPEVLDDRCSVSDGKLEMSNSINCEQYTTLILPSVKTISLSNMKKVEQAWKAGVNVIFTTQVPTQLADLYVVDDSITSIVECMLNGENGRKAIFVETPTAQTLNKALTLCTIPDVTFAGGSHPFNYIHKVIDNHHLYYFGNIDVSEATNTIILKHSLSSAVLMDPHTGGTKQAQLKTMEDGRTAISMHLYPNQSVFLVDDGLVNQNGIQEEAESERSSYTFESTICIESLSGSLCFAANGKDFLSMWQFNVSNDSVAYLRPHQWAGGHIQVLDNIQLSGKTDIKRGKAFKVRIEVEEERYARTYINNVLVDERAGNFPLGKFGFRQSHDKAFGAVETACFDDVKITMDKKNEFVKADFSDSNPFNGGVLADGQLLITGNMDHDIWVWLDETSE